AAAVAAAFTSGSDALLIAAWSTPCASRSPRSRTTASASIFCGLGASADARVTAARAPLNAALTRAAFPAAMAGTGRPRPRRSGALDQRLGRLAAVLGVGAHQGERADGGLDPAAQAVVHPHALELGLGCAARRLAGDGVLKGELIAVRLADDHRFVGLADIE